MARFVWVDNEELCNKFKGMATNINGSQFSYYDERDEGFIYDTQEKKVVMNFGNE